MHVVGSTSSIVSDVANVFFLPKIRIDTVYSIVLQS